MNDTFFRMSYYIVMNLLVFGAIYMYGRKYHPKMALWLSVSSYVVMMLLCYYNGTWIALSLILPFVYLYFLRKPSQKNAFQQLYAQYKILTTTKFSPDALKVLGNKNWRYAEGAISKSITEKMAFSFWQGHTTSFVSAGQYTRTTTYTYYLAFVFAPGSVSNTFKQIAMAAADKSHYTFWQKLKFFFVPDTETPSLVTTANDGSFIIQYTTLLDIECYSRRLNWLQENIGKMYFPSTSLQAAVNYN